MLKASRLACYLNRMEFDNELRARILDCEELFANGANLDRQFLGELAAGGVENCLSKLELPPRKFPHPTVAFVRWTLAHQHASTAADDRCHHTDGLQLRPPAVDHSNIVGELRLDEQPNTLGGPFQGPLAHPNPIRAV